MYNFKRHIAFFAIFILLTPSTIEILHVFEGHTHTVCKSNNEYQHIHESQLDCCKLHIPFEPLSLGVFSDYNIILPQHFFKANFNTQSKIAKIVHLNKKSSRAPPVLIA